LAGWLIRPQPHFREEAVASKEPLKSSQLLALLTNTPFLEHCFT
jgi:hypothetical protein